MNIQHLRYAIEVSKTGSITQAAENLFMGQPNLSKAIRELENSLNIRLFRRTTRGVMPTAEGEEFLNYARSIVAQVDKVEALYRTDRTSQIRFSLCAMPSLYVSEVFSRFCTSISKHFESASMHLSLREAARAEVIDAVADSTCDLGLMRCRADEEITLQSIMNRKSLDCTPLSLYKYSILMNRNHPLANVKDITQDVLAAYPRISLETTQWEAPYLYEKELSSVALSQGSIIVSGRDSVLMLLQHMPDAYVTSSPLPASLMERHGLILRQASGQLCRYRYLMIRRRGAANSIMENILHQEIINLRQEMQNLVF